MILDKAHHLDDVSRWFNDEINSYVATHRREEIEAIISSGKYPSLAGMTLRTDLPTVVMRFISDEIQKIEIDTDDIAYENVARTVARLVVDSTIARHFGKPQLLYLLMQSGKTGASVFYMRAFASLIANAVNKRITPQFISTRQKAHAYQTKDTWDNYCEIYADMTVSRVPHPCGDIGFGDVFSAVHTLGVTPNIILKNPTNLLKFKTPNNKISYVHNALNGKANKTNLDAYCEVYKGGDVLTIVDESHDATTKSNGLTLIAKKFSKMKYAHEYILFVSATPYDLFAEDDSVVITRGLYSPTYVGPVEDRLSPVIIEGEYDADLAGITAALDVFNRRKEVRLNEVLSKYPSTVHREEIIRQFEAKPNICIRVKGLAGAATKAQKSLSNHIKGLMPDHPLYGYDAKSYTAGTYLNSKVLVKEQNGKPVIIFVADKMRCAENVDSSVQLFIETAKSKGDEVQTASTEVQGFYGRACGEKKFFSTVIVNKSKVECLESAILYSVCGGKLDLKAKRDSNGTVTNYQMPSDLKVSVEDDAEVGVVIAAIKAAGPSYEDMKKFVAGREEIKATLLSVMEKAALQNGRQLNSHPTFDTTRISVRKDFGGGNRSVEREKDIEISLDGSIRFATTTTEEVPSQVMAPLNYIRNVIVAQKSAAKARGSI